MRQAGSDDAVFIRVALVAANVERSCCFEVAIEHARDAVLCHVAFAGEEVGADLIRLEEGAEAVVVGLLDRVVLVIVALGAVEGEAEDCLLYTSDAADEL